jgi:hypothetical protein
MGDEVLDLVVSVLGPAAPRPLAIGNVSDPQIKANGRTLKQQAEIAAQIDKAFGRRRSVCCAIAYRASIAEAGEVIAPALLLRNVPRLVAVLAQSHSPDLQTLHSGAGSDFDSIRGTRRTLHD